MFWQCTWYQPTRWSSIHIQHLYKTNTRSFIRTINIIFCEPFFNMFRLKNNPLFTMLTRRLEWEFWVTPHKPIIHVPIFARSSILNDVLNYFLYDIKRFMITPTEEYNTFWCFQITHWLWFSVCFLLHFPEQPCHI